ncbi:uncharacterized protein [Coffea arabica]|uniref:Uncharacterized protein isoform X2 n=1 Tax=Coffea arabica TaxID=13443 RepID=A0ABM4UB58_COFAR
MLHAITFLACDWTPLVFLFWLSQDVLGVDCHHRNNCSVDYKGNCITILPSHHIFLADDNKFILVLPLSSSFLWSDQELKLCILARIFCSHSWLVMCLVFASLFCIIVYSTIVYLPSYMIVCLPVALVSSYFLFFCSVFSKRLLRFALVDTDSSGYFKFSIFFDSLFYLSFVHCLFLFVFCLFLLFSLYILHAAFFICGCCNELSFFVILCYIFGARIDSDFQLISSQADSQADRHPKRLQLSLMATIRMIDGMFKEIYNGKKYHVVDIVAVLSRAWSAGVDRIIVTGGFLEESKEALAIAETDARLFCMVDVHLTRCKVTVDTLLNAILKLLNV